MAKNHKKDGRRRDDGSDKPEVAVAATSQPQHTPVLVTKDPELAMLLREACFITLEQGDTRELSEELRNRTEVLRTKVRELDRIRSQAFMRWLQSTGLDQGLVLPDKTGQARNLAQGTMWILFPWNARFFSAWTRLLTFANRYDLKRPSLDNRRALVAAAGETLGRTETKPILASVEDLNRPDFMDLLKEQTQFTRQYDSIVTDIQVVQESIDKIIAAHQRRAAGEEITEEAEAAFTETEEEAQPTPASLREEANKLLAEAKKAAEAGDYEMAALKKRGANQFLGQADDLEKSLAEAEKAALAEEVAQVPLVSTTNEVEPTLAETAKVIEVLVETPESLEAEIASLEVQKKEAVANEKFSLAQSLADRIKALKTRAAEMRAEAKRKAAAAAEAEKAKAAAATKTVGEPPKSVLRRVAETTGIVATAPVPPPTEAPIATAPKKTRDQAITALQESFYAGKISAEEFTKAVIALG